MTTSFQTRIHAVLLCLSTAVTLGALPTVSSADDSLPMRKVSYADLDISKPAGAKVLYGRIVAAARGVCAINGTRDLRNAAIEHACMEQAIDHAVKDVDSSELSALRPGSVTHLASN